MLLFELRITYVYGNNKTKIFIFMFMFIVTIILFECYIIVVRTKFEFPSPKVGGLGPKKPKTMNLKKVGWKNWALMIQTNTKVN